MWKKGKLQLHEWIQGNEIRALTRQCCWELSECYTREELWDHRRACASLCHQLVKRTAKCEADPEPGFQLGLKGCQHLAVSAASVDRHHLQRELLHRWEEVCTWMVGEDTRGHGKRDHDPSPAHAWILWGSWGSYLRGSSSVVWIPGAEWPAEWEKHAFLPCWGPWNSGASCWLSMSSGCEQGSLNARLWI